MKFAEFHHYLQCDYYKLLLARSHEWTCNFCSLQWSALWATDYSPLGSATFCGLLVAVFCSLPHQSCHPYSESQIFYRFLDDDIFIHWLPSSAADRSHLYHSWSHSHPPAFQERRLSAEGGSLHLFVILSAEVGLLLEMIGFSRISWWQGHPQHLEI